MTTIEPQTLIDSLKELDIITFSRSLDVGKGFPSVSWDGDQAGFIDAARALRPTDAYISKVLYGKELVEYLEDSYDDPDVPDLETVREVIDEVREQTGQEAGVQAAFLTNGIVHQYTAMSAEYTDFLRRIREASDDYYGDKVEAAENSEFFKNKRQWLDRLFNRLIVDEEYITGRNETVRGARVAEIIEEEFGSEYSHSGWYPAVLKADTERKRIVEERKTAARAAIPSWAEEVAALPAFQAARTQVVRRNVTKTFLADREPLVVSGEFVALLEEEASRVSSRS